MQFVPEGTSAVDLLEVLWANKTEFLGEDGLEGVVFEHALTVANNVTSVQVGVVAQIRPLFTLS